MQTQHHNRRRSLGKSRGHRRREAFSVHPRRLGMEMLENRLVLSTFTVVNTDDVGLGSLRWAIEEANAEDIKVYEWVKNEHWPKQLAQSKLNLESELERFKEENSQYTQRREPLCGQLTRDLLYKPLLRFVSNGMFVNVNSESSQS